MNIVDTILYSHYAVLCDLRYIDFDFMFYKCVPLTSVDELRMHLNDVFFPKKAWV